MTLFNNSNLSTTYQHTMLKTIAITAVVAVAVVLAYRFYDTYQFKKKKPMYWES